MERDKFIDFNSLCHSEMYCDSYGQTPVNKPTKGFHIDIWFISLSGRPNLHHPFWSSSGAGGGESAGSLYRTAAGSRA